MSTRTRFCASAFKGSVLLKLFDSRGSGDAARWWIECSSVFCQFPRSCFWIDFTASCNPSSAVEPTMHCGAAYRPFPKCTGDNRDHCACVGDSEPFVEDDNSKLSLANLVRHVTKMTRLDTYVPIQRKVLEPPTRS